MDCCESRLRQQLGQQEDRKEVFGELRPGAHANWQGCKFVASGNTLHYQKEEAWRTPADFLRSYLLRTLGLGWVKTEMAKSLQERHPIMKWYDSMYRLLQKQPREPNGLIGTVPNGPMNAFMLLAHDLYALNHHAYLKETVVQRLKQHAEFYGARHELLAAAVCIRAGFEIEHEDESQKDRKHTEFVAIHKKTGQRIQVEAKHRKPVELDESKIKREEFLSFKMNRLFKNAAEKPLVHPYVVFVELSIPPLNHQLPDAPWFQKFLATMDRLRNNNSGRSPFNLVVLTNFADFYGPNDAPAPARYGYSQLEHSPCIQVEHPEALEEIRHVVERYGRLPRTFDEM
jgi:hypothetical protein